jgi:CheY-like chemotaxis protein
VADYAMPGMSGAELVAEARRRRRDLRVIIATGYVETGTLEDVTEGVPVLKKPFTLSGLAEKLREVQVRSGEAGHRQGPSKSD